MRGLWPGVRKPLSSGVRVVARCSQAGPESRASRWPAACHKARGGASREAFPLLAVHKQAMFDVSTHRQRAFDCFKSRRESIEFAVAIPTGLAERDHSFVSFSHHSCFSSGYRSMNTKLALSALVAALMLTACAKQEAASPDTAAAPPATTEAAPAARFRPQPALECALRR